jgi:AcrR family transcriptional regulator
MDIASALSVRLKIGERKNKHVEVSSTEQLARLVRYLHAASEGNVTLTGKRLKDRRVQRTQSLLHEALALLIHEKDYDCIVVKEILDRANVGRSTFYTHFRDKDDLLVSGIHDMLHAAQPTGLSSSGKRYEKIMWFSLPIFEHIDRCRRNGKAIMGTKGRAIIHEHLQKLLAELIAENVRQHSQEHRKPAGPISPDLLVQYVASTFILVLNWWVENKSPLPPKEGNDLFRALILPTLEAAFE